MKTRLLLMIAVLVPMASSALAADPVDRIAQGLVDSGHRKVAVLPTVISRRGDAEGTTGALGARSRLMAHEVYKKLVSYSQRGRYKGKFRVVPERTLRKAIKARGLTTKTMGDPEAIKGLGEVLGRNVAMFTLTDDESAEFDGYNIINAETIDTDDNFVTHSEDFADDNTLAKAAYSGESWELRRWENGELENVAIDLDGKKAFGQSVRWEQFQYERLEEGLQHPYDIPDFPYSFEVIVDGDVREPQSFQGVHGKQYVLELNPSEVYKVRLNNQSDEPVFVALFIDGVNSIDKQRMEPADLETRRHWYLKADSGVRDVAGWYMIDRDEDQGPNELSYYNEFKITPKEDSVAFGLGFDDEKIGMITAIFYTVGMEGIDEPDDDELKGRGLPRAQFGTGLGDRKEKELEFPSDGRKPRGIMLAAVTYYYRTAEELEDLESGDNEEDLAFIPFDEDEDDN